MTQEEVKWRASLQKDEVLVGVLRQPGKLWGVCLVRHSNTGSLTWTEARWLAEKLGGVLPTPTELAFIFDRMQQKIPDSTYWTNSAERCGRAVVFNSLAKYAEAVWGQEHHHLLVVRRADLNHSTCVT